MGFFDDLKQMKRAGIAKLKGFDFQTVQDASVRLKRHPSRIAHMAQEGKVPGAFKFGKSWMIPKKFTIKKKKKKEIEPKKQPDALALKDPAAGKRMKRRKNPE